MTVVELAQLVAEIHQLKEDSWDSFTHRYKITTHDAVDTVLQKRDDAKDYKDLILFLSYSGESWEICSRIAGNI